MKSGSEKAVADTLLHLLLLFCSVSRFILSSPSVQGCRRIASRLTILHRCCCCSPPSADGLNASSLPPIRLPTIVSRIARSGSSRQLQLPSAR